MFGMRLWSVKGRGTAADPDIICPSLKPDHMQYDRAPSYSPREKLTQSPILNNIKFWESYSQT